VFGLLLVAVVVTLAECCRFEEEERCPGSWRSWPSQDSWISGVVWTDRCYREARARGPWSWSELGLLSPDVATDCLRGWWSSGQAVANERWL